MSKNDLMQIIISFLIIVIGQGCYSLVTYLIDIPGRNKIERVYESKKEKKERERKKRSISKIYFISLVIVVLLINLVFYYL